MKTFNNKPELKGELLTKLKHHQELDAFVQGSWLTEEKIESNGFKGCMFGCTMQTKHNALGKFSKKYHVDLWYCQLTEKLFEGLPDGEYQTFPYNSIDVLPVGVDLNVVKSRFYYSLLENQLRFCEGNEGVTNAVKECMKLFKVPFDQIPESAARSAAESARSAAAWSAARSAAAGSAWSATSATSAWSAARSAWSAAESAWSAAESAWSAAESAAESARSAAWSAAESAAESARSAARSAEIAKKNYYVWMKDLLFECITGTKLDKL